jgi:hypothetical protein
MMLQNSLKFKQQ